MSTTTQAKLSRLAKTVRLNVEYGAKLDYDKQSKWQREANGYSCTLKYKNRQYTFDFWQGVGINGEPTAAGCLDCLLGDAQGGEQSFEDFCSDFGCDTDSREAEKLWRACQNTMVGMRRLLREDYETFLYSDRD